MFLLLACAFLTAAYHALDDQGFDANYSWGTVLPWIGWCFSFTVLPTALLLPYYKTKSQQQRSDKFQDTSDLNDAAVNFDLTNFK